MELKNSCKECNAPLKYYGITKGVLSDTKVKGKLYICTNGHTEFVTKESAPK